MVNRLVSVDDTNFLPSTVLVGEANLPAWAKQGALGGKVGKGDLVYSVLDYGAVADAIDGGGTDNTAAFQDAMDAAWGGGKGGTMLIPPGAYHLFGYVKLRSNVRIIGHGATVRKYGLSGSTYTAFQALSSGSKGYGSSARNVTFEGLAFRGRFSGPGTGNGIAVTMHHAQDVTFRKCVWTETNIGGHAIDLMGCSGIVVDDCTFSGFNPSLTDNREYVEAIQLDYSMADGGGDDMTASFDGLPTVNVTVQNSRFLPQTIGLTTYPAPNPLGSHSRVDGRWFEDIKFINNYVEGCHEPVSTDGFAVLCKGWLHFFCTRGVEIRGNHFKNTTAPGAPAPRAARVIAAYSITTGTSLPNVGIKGAASVAIAHMSMQNMTIRGNTFEGFASDTADNIMDVRGTTTVKARNIKVADNTVKDSWSTPGVTGDKGQEVVYLQDVTGTTLSDNYLNNAKSLLKAFRCNQVGIRGGQLTALGTYIMQFNTCNDISISSVQVDGHGGGYWFFGGTYGLEVHGGSILNGRSDALRPKHFSISGATEFSVRNMRIPKDGNGYTSAIDIYSTSTKGKVKDNFATGWGSDASFVSFGSGSSATVSENVY